MLIGGIRLLSRGEPKIRAVGKVGTERLGGVDSEGPCQQFAGEMMSAEWFYMSTGWLRKAKRVGPISEAELLARIDKGQIEPETLVQSAKTRNKWVQMHRVGPAMERWKKAHPDQADHVSG